MIYFQQGITEFLDSNIVGEVDEYDPLVDYEKADFVRLGYYRYKSLYGESGNYNTGNNPITTDGVAWYEYESSNLYACLDPYSETRTSWDSDGYVVFAKGGKDAISITNFTASEITIEYLNDLDEVLETQTYTFSVSAEVIDEWTYGYAPFESNTSNTVYQSLKLLGTKVKVTFKNNGGATDCGSLYAGTSVWGGDTQDEVSLPGNLDGTTPIPTGVFTTWVDREYLTIKTTAAKKLTNETMMFIIDESPNSYHGNIPILGTIEQCDGTASTASKNPINWKVVQTILT